MKHLPKLLLASLSAAASISTANAGLVIGWQDFADDNAGAPFVDTTPDTAFGGVSGSADLTAAIPLTGAGSTDGTYGNFGGPPNPTPTTTNFAAMNPGMSFVMSITNALSNPALALSGLLFDAVKASVSGGGDLFGSWSINGGAVTNIGAPFLFAPGLNGFNEGGSFNSYGFGMAAVLQPGDTITFNFSTPAGSAVGMDNVGLLGDFAVVAVPEPTGVIGLGALVTLGFCGRRRSVRRAVATVA